MNPILRPAEHLADDTAAQPTGQPDGSRDTPDNPHRRRLVLGLTGGLLAGSPWLMVGCGGGGGSNAPAPGPTDPTPPGPAGTATVRTAVEWPAGVAQPAGRLQMVSITGAVDVSGGAAELSVVESGPQLAAVVAADGTPMLYGWAGSGRPALSARSTAQVLLHFALGLPLLPPALRDALRERLDSRPELQTLADAVSAALAAHPRALLQRPPALEAALGAAAAALLPPATAAGLRDGRARRLGLLVEPAGQRSGISVEQGDAVNTAFADNIYVRRAVMFVNREAWVGSDGQRVVEAQAPVQVGEAIPVPLPVAFDSLASTVSGWANQYYSGDGGGLFNSATDPVTLPVTPDGARSTEYSVVVLMPNLLSTADPARYGRLPASQRAWLTGLDLSRNLVLQTVLIDFVAPLLFSFLSDKLGKLANDPSEAKVREDALKAFGATVLGVLQNRMPDLVQRLSEGTLSPGDAFKTVVQALTIDLNTLEPSPLLADLLGKLAEMLAKRLTDVAARQSMLDIASRRFATLVGPLLRSLSLLDQSMAYAQQVRVFADVARSRAMEEWSVRATLAKVKLTPDPFEVDPLGSFMPITAQIVDNDNDVYGREKGSIRFDWVCSARYGTLFKRGGGQESNRFSTSNANATCDYQPSGVEPGAEPETIEVTAWFEPIGSSQAAQRIGSFTATVKWRKAFSLVLSPAGELDYPTELRLPLLAQIKEPLPTGTTVTWTWRHAGVGRVEADARYGDIFARQTDSSARDLITDKAEGLATVTVQAQIDVPGSTTRPPRSVLTDPVALRVNVRSNVETITLYPPGGVFKCSDTRACGVSEYGAYIVPVIDRAISYTAVFTGFNYGPCNRSVTWTRPLGDGGGCAFPITYHPHNAVGPTNLWAVWLGFGGAPWAPEGRCEVRIVLRKP